MENETNENLAEQLAASQAKVAELGADLRFANESIQQQSAWVEAAREEARQAQARVAELEREHDIEINSYIRTISEISAESIACDSLRAALHDIRDWSEKGSDMDTLRRFIDQALAATPAAPNAIMDAAFSVVVAWAQERDDVPENTDGAIEALREALPYDAFEHSRRKVAPGPQPASRVELEFPEAAGVGPTREDGQAVPHGEAGGMAAPNGVEPAEPTAFAATPAAEGPLAAPPAEPRTSRDVPDRQRYIAALTERITYAENADFSTISLSLPNARSVVALLREHPPTDDPTRVK